MEADTYPNLAKSLHMGTTSDPVLEPLKKLPPCATITNGRKAKVSPAGSYTSNF